MSGPRYLRVTTIDEAVAASAGEGVALMAGGTDLMNDLRLRTRRPAVVVDLDRVPELRVLDAGPPVRIGAGVTVARLLDALPAGRLAALVDAAELFGGRQIRASATVGGNLCSASPAAELATPLLVLDAVAEVVGPGGAREVALADFFLGPRRTALGAGEVLRAIRLPAGVEGAASAYRRLELRRSVDIALVSTSVRLDVAGDEVVGARVAVGAAAPTPFRAEEAEGLLVGLPVAAGADDGRVAAAAAAVAAAARPIDDVRASAAYRRAMLEVVAARAVAAALARVVPADGTRR